MRPFPFFRHAFWLGLGVSAFVSVSASLSRMSGKPFTVRGYVDDGSFFLMTCLGWAFMGFLFGAMFAGWLQWRASRDQDLPWFGSLIAGLLYCPFVIGGILVALWSSGLVTFWISEQGQNIIIGSMAMVLMFGTPFLLANVGRGTPLRLEFTQRFACDVRARKHVDP